MTSRFAWLKKLPFAPIVSALFGLVAAILVFATPLWLFERAVVASGLPAILPPARPPLGDTARLGSAVILGMLTFAALWSLLKIVSRMTKARIIERSQKARGVRIDPVPAAPHRAPIFAEQELGAPFMSQEAMDVARSELILDAPIVEAPLDEVDTVIAPAPEVDTLQPAPEPALAAPPQPDIAMQAPRAVPPVDSDSISGLMSRLERALDRRSVAGNPIPLGNIAALRRALGAGR
jgi:hypothetical protein